MTEQAPVTISIIGTGNSTGGGVAPTQNGTIATTPGAQPDLKIQVIGPMKALAVRGIHVFLTTFFGALGAGTIGATPADWTWKTAATIAAGAAFLETGKNLITIFGRLEGTNPLITGSI